MAENVQDLISEDNFAVRGQVNDYTAYSKETSVEVAQKLLGKEFSTAKEFFDFLGKKRARFANLSGDVFSAMEFGQWRDFSGNPHDRFVTRLEPKYSHSMQSVYKKNPDLALGEKFEIDIKNSGVEYSNIAMGEFYNGLKFKPLVAKKLTDYPVESINPQFSETNGYIRHSYKEDTLEHSWGEVERIFADNFVNDEKKTPKKTKENLGEMMWHFYQVMPYMRGSASVGDWAINACLAAKGIKPAKNEFGVMLDLEAICSNSPDEFKKDFADGKFFEKKLEKRQSKSQDIIGSADLMKNYVSFRKDFIKEAKQMREESDVLKNVPEYDAHLLLLNIKANKLNSKLCEDGDFSDEKAEKFAKDFLFLNAVAEDINASFGISHTHSICLNNGIVDEDLKKKGVVINRNNDLFKKGFDGTIKDFYRAENINFVKTAQSLAKKNKAWAGFAKQATSQFNESNAKLNNVVKTATQR